MFQINSSDGLARVGDLHTKHGSLCTPALFPVHNLGADGGWNTPRYWERFPEINTAMFNAAFLSMNKKGQLGNILQMGVHSFMRFFGVAFADSGGFIYKKYRLTIKPEKILEVQEKLGVDIATTLDYPIQCEALLENTNIIRTINNAKLAYSAKKDAEMLLYASINGYDPIVIKNSIRHLKKHCNFDGFAIGSLMPRFSNHRLIIDTILAAKLEAGDIPIHVYGLGSPIIIHLLVYLGVDSFDSSNFVVASGKRNYFIPGYKRAYLQQLDNYEFEKCNCPICAKHTLEELRKSRELLTFHNIWTLWHEIDQIKLAIKEGRFEEHLNFRFRKAKWALKAMEYAKRKILFRYAGV